ncbi:MAG: recombinase family protein [Pseudonocardiales bacterium]|nr:MAG: recombinase family protein [Pseudonocardiales bacterium]
MWHTAQMPQSVAIYCRISRDRAGSGLGVDRQEADCRELAARLGWPVTTVHVDNDISASNGKRRPGYQRLVADLEAGRTDGVIAWHPDRLHRKPIELEKFISVCEEHAVAVQTVRAGTVDLATSGGRMVARMLGASARHETEHMIERIQAQKRSAGRAGHYRGGRRPFGYDDDGTTVRAGEAARLLDAAQRVLLGESLSALAREWTAQGVLSAAWHQRRVPTVWTPAALRTVLLRPRNAALIELDGDLVAAKWPAIMPEHTWRALRTLCGTPGRRHATTTEPRWLGSGQFVCGVCGACVRAGSNAVTKPVYRCKASAHLSRAAGPVDELITELVLARLSAPDARLLLHTDPGVDTEGLAVQAAALRVRRSEQIRLHSRGVISEALLAEGLADLTEQLDECEAAMARAVVGSPLEGFADATDVAAAWAATPVSRRKVVISALMTVTLAPPGRGARQFDPSTIRVMWKTGR